MAYMVIDTETVSIKKTAHPIAKLMRTYDVGWVVCANDGSIVEKQNYLVWEIFGDARLMSTAYYADKVPMYWNLANNGKIRILKFQQVWGKVLESIKHYSVKVVWAYNCKFDVTSLNATINHFSNGFVSDFFPSNVKVRDIWDYSSNITSTTRYVSWVVSHGFVTNSGNPSTTAENVFRYLNDNLGFSESHTALDDAVIENSILVAAKRRHKRTAHTVGRGWCGASRTMQEMMVDR